MPSTRLKKVYNSAAWQRARKFVLMRAGYRCEWLDPDTRERCRVRHTKQKPLTVDHKRDDVDPCDVRFLWALCRPHHGKKDGGRQFVNGQRRS